MSSGVDNTIWEEEQVTRMLDLDESGGEEGDSDDSRPSPAEDAAPPSAAQAQDHDDHPSPADDGERWSDITDPFEEFHFKGALQTEECQPTPTTQPPGSLRSQFLRAVSLFSPAHQLAVLEARDEQGVSLLERSTSLTAEPLDMEPGVAPFARSLSLPADHLRSSLRRSRSPRSTRSCSIATEPSALGLGGGTRTRPSATSSGGSPRPSAKSGTTRSRSGSRGTSASAGSPRAPSFIDSDPNIDPTLAELLRALWADPPPPERSPRLDAGVMSRDRARDRDRDTDNDVLSGLWRMLDCYEEFKCSPPGYHAFRQEKPHWLDQEPIPWAVREAAREKCLRWLQSCPLSPAARARELRIADGDNRRRSMYDAVPPPPLPPRSLTSTPALADHVPALTAVRRLKKYKSNRP